MLAISPTKSPIQSGSAPTTLQFAMKIASSLIRLDKHSGSGPGSKLLPPVYSPRLISFKLTRRPTDSGTAPVSLLPNNCSSSRPTSSPTSSGIGPVKPQRQMHSRRSDVTRHSDCGMRPHSAVSNFHVNGHVLGSTAKQNCEKHVTYRA